MAKYYRIRDPVHNYIYLTDVEKKLINHPLFQRLRFISQNGLAYYTYPSNRTCRFVHSLGVMQIAGNIFLNSLNDISFSEEKDYLSSNLGLIDYISRQIGSNVCYIADTLSGTNDKTLSKHGLSLNFDIESEKDISDDKKLSLTKTVLFQSIRLAAVLHDLGHLPLSHLMENTIYNYLFYNICHEEICIEDNEVYNNLYHKFALSEEDSSLKGSHREIHENIGLQLLEEVLPSKEDHYHILCRKIAEKILNKENTEYTENIDPLRSLITSELDADRLDYVMRDPRSSGLELGAYDIERLTCDFSLIYADGSYFFLPKVQALSAIESFFHQRYLVYKYLIFHHSKIRFDEIVSEITIILLNIYHNHNKDDARLERIEQVLKSNQFHILWDGFLSNDILFYNCNDNWFINLLQNLYMAINDEPSLFNERRHETYRLQILLETLLLRKTDNMISLFKRYNEYSNFIAEIKNRVDESENEGFNKKLFYVIKDVFGNFSYRRSFNLLKDEIYKEYEIILLMHRTAPKLLGLEGSSGESMLQVIVEESEGIKKKEPVSHYSPYLKILSGLSSEDQNFHIFLIGRRVRQNQNAVTQIKSKLLDFFVSCYNDVEVE